MGEGGGECGGALRRWDDGVWCIIWVMEGKDGNGEEDEDE